MWNKTTKWYESWIRKPQLTSDNVIETANVYLVHTHCSTHTHTIAHTRWLTHCIITHNTHTYGNRPNLSVRVFDCWVIFLYKDTLNELDSLEETTGTNCQVGNTTHSHPHHERHTHSLSLTKALLPTPPDPSTTSLYSRILNSSSRHNNWRDEREWVSACQTIQLIIICCWCCVQQLSTH